MKSREDIVKAIKEGNSDTVKEYITQADTTQINAQDDEGNTLLHVAVKHVRDSFEVTGNIPHNLTDVISLLAKHVDRRKRNEEKKLAVHLLLECEVMLYDDYFEDPSLCSAGLQCMVPVLDALLTEEHIEEECVVAGRYILHEAAVAGEWDVVRLLVKKGIDVRTVDSSRCTALYHLTTGGQDDVVPDDIVEKLSHPDVINKKCDDSGFTPLMKAASGDSHMIKQLIRNGADNTIISNSRTALINSSSSYQLSIEARTALIHPSIVNQRERLTSETALFGAVSQGNIAFIDELLRAGADVNVKNVCGHKPIDKYANMSPKVEAAVIKKLLPTDGEDNTDTLVEVILRWLPKPPQDMEDVISTISMLLVRTGRDDFFKTHRIARVNDWFHQNTLELSLYNGLANSAMHPLKMFALCLIVRKGMGCSTRPELSEDILDRTSPIQLEQVERINTMWDNPHSLSELCCFTIRDHMRNLSKPHNLLLTLELPKAIEDIVMFRDVAREVCKEMNKSHAIIKQQMPRYALV